MSHPEVFENDVNVKNDQNKGNLLINGQFETVKNGFFLNSKSVKSSENKVNRNNNFTSNETMSKKVKNQI